MYCDNCNYAFYKIPDMFLGIQRNLLISPQYFEKFSNIKYHKFRPVESELLQSETLR